MRTWIGIALVAVLALTVTAQPSPETVSIDAAEVINEVNPLVFGANFGPLNTVPLELKEEALAAGLPYLRFPGGRVGDLGDIPNFQIDLYMAVCKMMNCTPAISARQENGTPEKAAEMVRYVNVTKGYGVKYWSVGNEPDLWDGYTPERHSAEWRVFAEAMLAVDPDILFVGPDISQFTGVEGDSQQRAHDFLREFLRVNGDLVDIVSVHRYPFGATAATVEGLQADASGWEQLIDNLHQFAADELGRSVPVAITEVKPLERDPSRGRDAGQLCRSTVVGGCIRADAGRRPCDCGLLRAAVERPTGGPRPARRVRGAANVLCVLDVQAVRDADAGREHRERCASLCRATRGRCRHDPAG